METPEENKEIFAAIEKYAKKHKIEITGSVTHLYSMFKHPKVNFPENTMFLSYNVRGYAKKDRSAVTIVYLSPDKITHCLSKHVLERPCVQESYNFNLRCRHSINFGNMIIEI